MLKQINEKMNKTELSLLPLDVGFDLRNTGNIVILPEEDVCSIKFLDTYDKPITLTANRITVGKVLKYFNYKVRD